MLRLALLSLLLIVVWISILPVIMPNRHRTPYSDDELRNKALSRSIRSIPGDFTKLKKLYKDSNISMTKEHVSLGRELFFDTNLSSDTTQSCASCHMLTKNAQSKSQFLQDITHPQSKTDCMVCHIQDESGSDRLAYATGAEGNTDPYLRNTLTILNASLAKYQLWDASSKSIQKTTKQMLQTAYIMNISKEVVVERVLQNPHYKKEFEKLFRDGVTFDNIVKALVSYQQTLVTRSAYDAFLDGNNSAMSDEAKRGLRNFIELGCKGCHTGVTVGGQTFQKFPVRDYNYIINVTGRYDPNYIGRRLASFEFNFKEHHDFPFENRGHFMGAKAERVFRVPILRNVTKTSPYFHNGAVFDLREAIYIMGKYQLSMELSEQQIDEIVAFFKALEANPVDYKELR